MRVMGFVNRFNRGVSTAQEELVKNGNEPAKFDLKTFGVFGVTIEEKIIENIPVDYHNPVDFGRVNIENGHVNDDFGRVNDLIRIDDLSEKEKILLYIIKDNENINQKNISELIQTPYRTLTRYLKNLKDKGLIEYIGSAKRGGYRITFKTS
jgi:ATP-dependent DNA helicase RecG